MRADAMDDALRAMVSLTQTDSTGRYRLDAIPAGRYYIAAGRVDLPTYYPGTLEVGRGTAVSISSAAPLVDIDFVIQETSASVPPGRGGIGLRARGANQIPSPNPLTRGRVRSPVPPAPTLPQIGAVPVAPNFNLPVLQQYQAGRNLVAVAAQPNAAWWTNAGLVARLGLTADQMKKVEATFDQHRQAIVQNTADLATEEGALSRLLEADPLEPAKTVSTQIERVIQARGELERTNSKMTLEMRQILTRAQWVQLQMETQLSLQVPLQLRGASPNSPSRGNRGNRGTP
jgi:Spy/CpxP family protein refolding chaperone